MKTKTLKKWGNRTDAYQCGEYVHFAYGLSWLIDRVVFNALKNTTYVYLILI